MVLILHTKARKHDGLVNLYEGNRDVALCLTPEDADEIIAALAAVQQRGELRDALDWLTTATIDEDKGGIEGAMLKARALLQRIPAGTDQGQGDQEGGNG